MATQITDLLAKSSHPAFVEPLKSGAVVKVLCVPGGSSRISSTRLKKGDVFQEARKAGLKNLPFVKVVEGGKVYGDTSLVCLSQVTTVFSVLPITVFIFRVS